MPVIFDWPSYPPPGEGPAELFLERCLFAGLCIVMFTYGIYLTITVGCLYFMIFHPLNGRRHWGLICFILMLLVGSTVFMISNYAWSQLMFIDARGFPGGPPAFFTTMFGIWINTISNSALCINQFMIDALVLWRCFVIWNYSKTVIAIPFLALLSTAVLAVLTLRQSVEPGTTPWLARGFATPYFALCLGLNILLTSLIVGRLLYMRGKLQPLGKQYTRVYTSLAAVIVDSALPYTLVSALVIVTITIDNVYGNYSSAFAVPLLGGVEWIVSMLILLRAAFGRGFMPESTMRNERSGLDFWSPSRPISTMITPHANAEFNRSSLQLDRKDSDAGLQHHQLQSMRPPLEVYYNVEEQRVQEPGSPRAFHLPLRVDGLGMRPEFVQSSRSVPEFHQQFDRRQKYDSGTPLIHSAPSRV